MKKKVGDLKIKYEKIKVKGVGHPDFIKDNPNPVVQKLLRKCIALGDNDYHTKHGVHGTSLRKYRKRKRFQKVN